MLAGAGRRHPSCRFAFSGCLGIARVEVLLYLALIELRGFFNGAVGGADLHIIARFLSRGNKGFCGCCRFYVKLIFALNGFKLHRIVIRNVVFRVYKYEAGVAVGVAVSTRFNS